MVCGLWSVGHVPLGGSQRPPVGSDRVEYNSSWHSWCEKHMGTHTMASNKGSFIFFFLRGDVIFKKKSFIYPGIQRQGRFSLNPSLGLQSRSCDLYRDCKSGSETIVTSSNAVTGNDLWRADCVVPSQSPIELTLR